MRSFAPIMVIFACLANSLVASASHDEVCFTVNLESAVDQDFISRLTSKAMPYTTPRPEWICVKSDVRQQVSALREEALPQRCMTFEGKTSYASIISLLRSEAIASWLEKPDGSLCYLLRDHERVERLVALHIKRK